jgi:hypothetical protein
VKKSCKQCGKEFGPEDLRSPGNFPRQKFCGTVCMHANKKFTPERELEVFWSRVDKTSHPGGCWLYTAGKDKWGYGDLRFGGKHIQAHRLAWKLLRGDPGIKDCLHICHNPTCCNPEHLYLGTDKENARDRVESGRHARGEKCRAKLTEEQAMTIKREYRRNGRRSNGRELAERYGVTTGAVAAIIAGRSWTHLQ